MKFTLAFLKSTGITRPPTEDLGGIHIINIKSLTRDLYGYQGDERTYTTFQTSDLIVMNGSQNDLIIEPSTYSIQFDTEKMLETSVNVSAKWIKILNCIWRKPKQQMSLLAHSLR
jgi:hypothetical protein